MVDDPRHLFVYGTLRRGASPMARLLRSGARYLGPATIRGRLYLIRHYPGAVPSEDPVERVHGELHRLLDPALLLHLDDYEECSARHPPPHEYRREAVRVLCPAGAGVTAWAWLYNRPVEGLEPIPSGDFLAHRPRTAVE